MSSWQGCQIGRLSADWAIPASVAAPQIYQKAPAPNWAFSPFFAVDPHYTLIQIGIFHFRCVAYFDALYCASRSSNLTWELPPPPAPHHTTHRLALVSCCAVALRGFGFRVAPLAVGTAHCSAPTQHLHHHHDTTCTHLWKWNAPARTATGRRAARRYFYLAHNLIAAACWLLFAFASVDRLMPRVLKPPRVDSDWAQARHAHEKKWANGQLTPNPTGKSGRVTLNSKVN